MGHEPESTLLAWQLLPIRLPTGSGIYAVGPYGNFVYLPKVNGELIHSCLGSSI